jgi:hypothetical protein
MFCEVIASVRDAMERSGILQVTGEDSIYVTVEEGVKHFLETSGK